VLKRGEFRENLCVSGIFDSYQILPCPKSVEPQHKWKTDAPQIFWRLILFYTAGHEKKYAKQYLECIIPFSASYLNFV